MKKANAILEYGFLLFIIVAVVSGMAKSIERHIKGYVKTATDEKLRKPIPFSDNISYTVNKRKLVNERWETFDGITEERTNVSGSFVVLQPPTPEGALNAALHIIDKARSAGQNRPRRRNPLARRQRNEEHGGIDTTVY